MAEVDGPAAALALVDALDLDRYHLFHAVRADLLRRLGRDGRGARRLRRGAIARADNAAERAFLEARRERSLILHRPVTLRNPGAHREGQAAGHA